MPKDNLYSQVGTNVPGVDGVHRTTIAGPDQSMDNAEQDTASRHQNVSSVSGIRV